MQFSRKIDYGILLLSALKRTYSRSDFFALKDIADCYKLPFAYFEKIAFQLKKAGILEAKPGVGGGYRLAKNPGAVAIQEIIDVFEEPKMLRCFQNAAHKSCSHIKSCPTQKGWLKFNNKISKVFQKTKISDVI